MPLSKEDLRRLRLEAEKVANKSLIERPELEEETLLHELTVQRIELELQNEQLLETERKLNETLERYTRLYHQAPVGYVTLDKKGIIREHNETFAQLLHLPAIKIKNSNFATFLSTDTDAIFRQRLAPFFKQPEGKLISVSLAPEGRPPVHIQVIGRRQTQEHEELIFCSIIDVTFQKQAEEERQVLEEQLHQKHKMEAVGYMAGGIAHNFNNNLSIILGNLELIEIKQDADSEILPYLANAKIGVRRSTDLVKKIITYSRQGTQKKVATHLNAITNESIDLLSSTLPSTVDIQKRYHPGCETIQVNADPSQIQEVLINLFNNAVHAMNEKGTLSVELEAVNVMTENIPIQYNCLPGLYAKLSVQDSGHGIPAEIQDKIFDPFFSTKKDFEGAGMGLSTVQGIVAQHNGMIKVKSRMGQGSTFELYFPVIQQTDIKTIDTQGDSLPRGTERILFVDDDEMLSDIGQKLLTELGYSISVTNDSEAALKLFVTSADHFDLVITDQTMPKLTGIDVIQEIKKVRSDIPTILCTGYSSKIDQGNAIELGISAFMMKPLNLPELAQTVRDVLDGEC